MRRTLFILGILALLVVAGCAPKQKAVTTKIIEGAAPQQAGETAPAQTAGQPAETASGQGAIEQPAQTQETAAQPEQKTVGSGISISSVTEDDLNKLKAGVEGLEPEDLGGLSSS